MKTTNDTVCQPCVEVKPGKPQDGRTTPRGGSPVKLNLREFFLVGLFCCKDSHQVVEKTWQ